MSDFFMLLLLILSVVFIITLFRSTRGAKDGTPSSTGTSTKPQTTSKAQMAEDIKATKTSQVSDAVSILEDLSATSDNYRHYCELVGSSMASGGVTAPYSRKQVAYYDIKCYRLDATSGGGQRETLVAHEHSFDPFFFTDLSCDTPIYVDLESFGNNVILVNSTNHIEGPNSDFAQAFKKSATAATSGAGSASNAYAMVSRTIERGSNALAWAADAIRSACTPHRVFQPQLALADGGILGADEADEARIAHVKFLEPRGSGHGSSGPKGGGHKGGDHGKGAPSSKSGISINIGLGGQPPVNMGSFMGGYGGGPWVMGGGMGYGHYGHHGNRPTTTTNSAEVLLGMGLGALLNSMTSSQQQAAQTYTTSTDTFRGYRLVENVVPLGSPVYCIGEIYHNGTDIYMGRSLAKDYPTSYFATKPETEVLSAIGSK